MSRTPVDPLSSIRRSRARPGVWLSLLPLPIFGSAARHEFFQTDCSRTQSRRSVRPEFLVLWHSRFQLAFDLVEKTPVGAVGDDFLRARLDQACFVHAQGIEPHRVLGVPLAPFVVW
jgi:hypothetical protein